MVENDAYERFSRNLFNSLNMTFQEYTQFLLNRPGVHSPNRYIKRAFLWGRTPEGFEYWSVLDTKWVMNYKKNFTKRTR